MNTARLVMGLRLLAVALGLCAALMWIRPPRVEPDAGSVRDGMGVPRLAPLLASDSAAGGRPTQADATVQQIVDGNIFSPRRRPPDEPYTPMLSDDEETSEAVADATDDMYGATDATGGDSTGAGWGADSRMSMADDVVPRLYGTMITPGNAAALLRLDSRLPTPQLYREGDRAGGFRVVRISEQAVTLAGSAGSITLRLPTSGKERP